MIRFRSVEDWGREVARWSLVICISLLAGGGCWGQSCGWEKKIGGNTNGNFVVKCSIIADSNGNCYVSGYFADSLPLGCDTLVGTSSGYGGFMVKYDSLGNCVWATKLSGTGPIFTVIPYGDLSLDGDGNLFTCGLFRDSLIVGGDTLVQAGGFYLDGFLMKIDHNGDVVWARKIAKELRTTPRSTQVTGDGHVFVLGNVQDSAEIACDTFSNVDHPLMVVKYTPNGDCEWTRLLGSVSQLPGDITFGEQFAITSAEELVIVGSYGPENGIQYGTDTLLFASDSFTDFVVKLDSGGNFAWVQGIRRKLSTGARLKRVSVDDRGNVWVVGNFTDTLIVGSQMVVPHFDTVGQGTFIAKFDAYGNNLWLTYFGERDTNFVTDAFLDHTGNMHLVGLFKNKLTLGTDTLWDAGEESAFIAIFDSNGMLLSTQRVAYSDRGLVGRMDLSLNYQGQIWVSGFFRENIIFLCDTITWPGFAGSFVARLPFSRPPTTYQVDTLTLPCTQLLTSLCLTTSDTISEGCWGLGYCLEYDTNTFRPTGNFTLGPVVTNPGGYAVALDTSTSGQVYAGIYLSGAQVNYLSDSGEVICLEFEMLSSQPDTHLFPVCDLTESYDPQITTTSFAHPSVSDGMIIVVPEDSIRGEVFYRADSTQKVGNEISFPLLTVYPASILNGNCTLSGTGLEPDTTGQIRMGNLPLGTNSLKFERDIPNTNPVMNVINSSDANQVFGIWAGSVTNPDVFTLISADTDGDGRILIGDMSAINARSVLTRGEFVGVPDWQFVSDSLLTSAPYVNANKNAVPRPPDCLPLVIDSSSNCVTIESATYHGILTGDVDATWTMMDRATLKTDTEQYYELRLGHLEHLDAARYRIPVVAISPDPIYGMDLDMNFEAASLLIETVIPSDGWLAQSSFLAWNVYQQERLFLTTGSQQHWSFSEPVMYLEVKSDQKPTAIDFGERKGYMNGEQVEVRVTHDTNAEMLATLTIYPNPTKGQFVVYADGWSGETVTGGIFNALGQLVVPLQLSGKRTQIQLEDLAAGVYTLRVPGHEVKRILKR